MHYSLDYVEVTSQQSDKILIVYHAGMFLLFKSSLQEMSAFIRLYTTEVLSVPAINTLRFQWVITQIASWFIPSKKGYPEDLPAWALRAALQLLYKVSKPCSGTACAGNTKNPSNYRIKWKYSSAAAKQSKIFLQAIKKIDFHSATLLCTTKNIKTHQ